MQRNLAFTQFRKEAEQEGTTQSAGSSITTSSQPDQSSFALHRGSPDNADAQKESKMFAR